MAKLLVTYATTEGHTAEVAQRIADVAASLGHEVEQRPIDATPADLDGFDAALVGASVHFGHHQRAAVHFAMEHREWLNRTPSAFFSVSLTAATPDERHDERAHQQVGRFIEETGWEPHIVGIFGDALAYTRYGFVKRHVMRSIARREHRDTDTSHDFDYTDWAAVEHFATDVSELLTAGAGTGGEDE